MSGIVITASPDDTIGADIQAGHVIRLSIGHTTRIELPYEQALRAIERLTSAADNLWTCDGCGSRQLAKSPTRYKDQPGKKFCDPSCLRQIQEAS